MLTEDEIREAWLKLMASERVRVSMWQGTNHGFGWINESTADDERRQKVLGDWNYVRLYLQENDRIDAKSLSSHSGKSVNTARHRLVAMEKMGFLRSEFVYPTRWYRLAGNDEPVA